MVVHHPEHVLRDERGRRADAPHGHKDVTAHKLGGELLDRLGERCGEHERLALAGGGHALMLDDAADLRLESHVEHPVGFVHDQVRHA